MNHIYKVVFNKVSGTFVAVSEVARAHGKDCSASVSAASEGKRATRFLMTALSGALLLAGGQVMAATGTTPDGAVNTCYYDTTLGTVVCGDATTVAMPAAKNAVVLGTGAVANNVNDIIVGQGAGQGYKDYGTVVGGTGKYYSGGVVSPTVATSVATARNIAVGLNAGKNAAGSDNVAIG